MRKIFKGLVLVQLALIAGLGLFSVFRFPVWNTVDESPHFAYIQTVAQEKRLPILEKDMISPEAVAIWEKSYPERSPKEAKDLGLKGYSYEAFQPPFYYLLMSPIFHITGDFLAKVYLIRFVNFILLLVSIAVVYKFIRLIDKNNYFLLLTFTLNFFLLPGVVITLTSVSNAVMELLFTLIFFYFAAKSYLKKDERALLITGIVLGLTILTKFTAVYLLGILLPLVVCFYWKKSLTEGLLKSFGIFIIPLLMLAPWLVFNLQSYGNLTANTLALKMQAPIVNPDNTDYRITDLVPMTLRYPETIFLHEEWAKQFGVNGLLKALLIVSSAALFFVPLVIALWRQYLIDRKLLLALPLALCIAMINGIVVTQDWPIALGRYLYPALPLWFVLAALIYVRFGTRVVLGITVTLSIISIFFWIRFITWGYI